MNTFHKFYIIIIAVILLLLFYFINRVETLSRVNSRQSSIISEKTDSISYIKTDRGKIIAEKDAAVASVKEFKEAYPAFAEEIKKEFDIKLKDMKAYMRTEFMAHGSGQAEVTNNYYIDSTGVKNHKWEMKASDGYLTFLATVYDSIHAPYEYFYSDTVTNIINTKKKWLFGNETLSSQVKFNNPNSRAIKMTNVVIDNYRDKRWGIMVGVSYSPFTPDTPVLPTITAGYNLFKF